METDLISVLIPAYNVQKYLGRCLRSIIRQTYQNLEIIVVDDGSTDRTFAIAKQYATQDKRIVLLQKTNESNIAKTRNFLLDHCRGKYCVWVDSDDFAKPRYIEKLHEAITTRQADLSACRFSVRILPLPVVPTLHQVTREYQGETLLPQMIYRTSLNLWNKMYRLDLINGENPIRFDPIYCYGEDLLFNLKYLQRCQKMVCINARLYSYSWRAGSEVHKKFSDNHANYVNRLLELCENENNLVARDTLCGWTAFNCNGLVYFADKRRYAEIVARMKHFAYQNRHHLYKNHLAKFIYKTILWLGLKTWCRPKRCARTQAKQ